MRFLARSELVTSVQQRPTSFLRASDLVYPFMDKGNRGGICSSLKTM